jgi:hypothetical protein
MGTLIGNRDRIAVEYELHKVEPKYRRWLYGNMTLWAAGQPINRHDELAAMTVALTSFPGILRDAGQRSDPRLMAKPAEEVFDIIYDSIYGDEPERTYHESLQIHLHFQPFEVAPSGFDVFDCWHIYLIEDRVVGRLIWQGPDKVVRETRIGAGEFDRVIDTFLTQLEELSGQTRWKPDT